MIEQSRTAVVVALRAIDLKSHEVSEPPIPHATVQVARLPKDARVEIDLVAVLGASGAAAAEAAS